MAEAKREGLPVRLGEIRYWSLWNGVACVVMREDGGWVSTACANLRTGGSYFSKRRPARVCRKCQAKLPDLRRASEVGDG